MELADFRNEPLSDFKANPEQQRRMKEALERVEQQLGREYDLVIGGERIRTEAKLTSYNPARPDQVVGVFSKGTPELADRAIRRACSAA